MSSLSSTSRLEQWNEKRVIDNEFLSKMLMNDFISSSSKNISSFSKHHCEQIRREDFFLFNSRFIRQSSFLISSFEFDRDKQEKSFNLENWIIDAQDDSYRAILARDIKFASFSFSMLLISSLEKICRFRSSFILNLIMRSFKARFDLELWTIKDCNDLQRIACACISLSTTRKSNIIETTSKNFAFDRRLWYLTQLTLLQHLLSYCEIRDQLTIQLNILLDHLKLDFINSSSIWLNLERHIEKDVYCTIIKLLTSKISNAILWSRKNSNAKISQSTSVSWFSISLNSEFVFATCDNISSSLKYCKDYASIMQSSLLNLTTLSSITWIDKQIK